jgi:anti-sigma regulatory factor (Ser/Thr protein kinase)
MPKEFRLRMRNSFSDLIELMRSANEFLETHALPPRIMYKANLALEEILTNIVKYAFNDPDDHEIAVLLIVSAQELVMEIVDDGLEFDPLSLPAPEAKNSVLDVEIGGLGVHLVREMMDSISYRRAESKNVLTIALRWNS